MSCMYSRHWRVYSLGYLTIYYIVSTMLYPDEENSSDNDKSLMRYRRFHESA